MPLWIAGLATAVATYVILGLEQYGFRWLEAVITAMVGAVAVCYLIELVLARARLGPGPVPLGRAAVFRHAKACCLAAGILGATVMPHVIFLHSALMQGRIVVRDPRQMRRLFHYEVIDVVIAMGMAGLINAAMLIMAAKTFHDTGTPTSTPSRRPTRRSNKLLGRLGEFRLRPLAAWRPGCPVRRWGR